MRLSPSRGGLGKGPDTVGEFAEGRQAAIMKGFMPSHRRPRGAPMSPRPNPLPPVPEGTARVAHAVFPRGNTYLRLRDELGGYGASTIGSYYGGGGGGYIPYMGNGSGFVPYRSGQGGGMGVQPIPRQVPTTPIRGVMMGGTPIGGASLSARGGWRRAAGWGWGAVRGPARSSPSVTKEDSAAACSGCRRRRRAGCAGCPRGRGSAIHSGCPRA